MLCVRLKAFDKACQATTGGISRIWIFDREDFNFTQALADGDGNAQKYSAIAVRTAAGADDADGAVLFPVQFQYKEAEYRYTHSLNGSSVKYEHVIEFLLPDLDHFITQWNERVDAASACCGIGIIVELNSGKILVLGEKYVNDSAVREFRMAQNGSTGTSGRLFEDPNGQTTLLTGDYFRSAYEYSGTIASLEALEAQSPS